MLLHGTNVNLITFAERVVMAPSDDRFIFVIVTSMRGGQVDKTILLANNIREMVQIIGK